MKGRTKAGGHPHAPTSGGPWTASEAVPKTDQVAVVVEAPDGYTLPPSAAQVILRVMKDVAAREGAARLPIGRAG